MAELTSAKGREAQDEAATCAKTLLRAVACGPKRARSLTLNESKALLIGWSEGWVPDVSLGAALMVMRSRGESSAEVAGMALALRELIDKGLSEPGLSGWGEGKPGFIDWPCYAGKRGQFPWLLYGVKRLEREGIPVLLHGDSETDTPSRRCHVGQMLAQVGIPKACSIAEARSFLRERKSCYLPLDAMLPQWSGLKALHRQLGIRSLITQALKFINPLDAPMGMRAFFHPKLEGHYAQVMGAIANETGVDCRQLLFRGFQGETEPNPRVDTPLWCIEPLAQASSDLDPLQPRWHLSACAPEGTQATLTALGDDMLAHRRLAAAELPGAFDDSLQGASVCASLAAAYLLGKRASTADEALRLAYGDGAEGESLVKGSGAVATLCRELMAAGAAEAEAVGLVRRYSMQTGKPMVQLAQELLRQRSAAAR
ncbi:hypothetical protein [Shewanella sp.]|uniref:hypothetical protein n=1 Tax=Shewanella sp. TaxID=50422 RepID=UPI003566EB4B